MAHSAEQPELYVCSECQTVHAGTVVEVLEGGDHSYEPPATCGACQADSFVESEMWPHEHE